MVFPKKGPVFLRVASDGSRPPVAGFGEEPKAEAEGCGGRGAIGRAPSWSLTPKAKISQAALPYPAAPNASCRVSFGNRSVVQGECRFLFGQGLTDHALTYPEQNMVILWMDEVHFAPPKKPWNDSPVHAGFPPHF